MNSSPTDAEPQDGPPNKKPQIGRREIGALLLLLAINWTLVLLFYGAAARQRVAIPYSPTFVAQVQAGNISTVTAQGAAIQGTLKRAIRNLAREKNEALYKAETLEGPEAYAAAGLGPSAAATPPAESATLVAQ